MTLDAALTVKPADTLRTAHERMRDNGCGMVAVVGHGGASLGTVTDGAIRRAMLTGAGLDAGVDRAMSAQPLTASKRATKKELLALLRTHRLRSIPIVADGRLVDVRSLASSGAPGRRRRSRS